MAFLAANIQQQFLNKLCVAGGKGANKHPDWCRAKIGDIWEKPIDFLQAAWGTLAWEQCRWIQDVSLASPELQATGQGARNNGGHLGNLWEFLGYGNFPTHLSGRLLESFFKYKNRSLLWPFKKRSTLWRTMKIRESATQSLGWETPGHTSLFVSRKEHSSLQLVTLPVTEPLHL